MAGELITLELRDVAEWRSWLEHHYSISPGVWLVFYKKHTNKSAIAYEESVREALCFGWIDSLIKRIDDHRHAYKFTPRKPGSKWSELNRKRWAELKAAGLLRQAGLAAAPTDNSYGPRPAAPDMPPYIRKALQGNREAWKFFQQLAPSHRKQFVMWIHLAKRPETREKRIRESIALLAAGQKLGLK